ncbi:hypothetical protein EB796_008813 [Bugula neritina]|uniref:Uncharacterized protein n=1 Tax=Bugula neritina TaxID=10212 RepID=A0A7J7K3V8_BUGNE|nr:hypothetical protein EB796_008813 [Bugula neritina]
MGCYQGHVFDVDQSTFAQCFDVIRPLVRDPNYNINTRKDRRQPQLDRHGYNDSQQCWSTTKRERNVYITATNIAISDNGCIPGVGLLGVELLFQLAYEVLYVTQSGSGNQELGCELSKAGLEPPDMPFSLVDGVRGEPGVGVGCHSNNSRICLPSMFLDRLGGLLRKRPTSIMTRPRRECWL